MIDEKELDDFLEHFGVKGQKWGVRHDRSKLGSSGRVKRFVKEHKKILVEAGVGSVATGAIIAAAILRHKGNINAIADQQFIARQRDSAGRALQLLDSRRNIKMRTLNKMMIPKNITDLNSDQYAKIARINKLKSQIDMNYARQHHQIRKNLETIVNTIRR